MPASIKVLICKFNKLFQLRGTRSCEYFICQKVVNFSLHVRTRWVYVSKSPYIHNLLLYGRQLETESMFGFTGICGQNKECCVTYWMCYTACGQCGLVVADHRKWKPHLLDLSKPQQSVILGKHRTWFIANLLFASICVALEWEKFE
jgi:hypothetical protein